MLSETVVGAPATAPVEPPAPLDPPKRRSVARELTEGVDRVARCARQMAEAFEGATYRAVPPEREYHVRWAAWRVLGAGGDWGYVTYVCEKFRERHGRRPQWSQVFGQKAVDAWLPEYTRRQAETAERATYELSKERQRAYHERMRKDLLPEGR